MKEILYTALLILVINGCSGGNTVENNNEDVTHPESRFVNIGNFINYDNCDQVIDKEFSTGRTIEACYDYDLKASTFVAYTLDGDLVYENNIVPRPDFYSEPTIPRDLRSKYSDWTHSGYDRGHLPPDASFDYNDEDLYIIYSLVFNIAQDRDVNRLGWADLEKYARDISVSLGELTVLNGVIFDDNPQRIGSSSMAVPSGFYKVLINEDANFQECYYYDNFILGDIDLDNISLHQVDCQEYL